MKLYFLGTCSGTEPMPHCRHASVVVEHNDRLYWFDAGEACSVTAHTMGLDILKLSDVIISHCHIDHIGGLANLLWCIKKLRWRFGVNPPYPETRLHIPDLDAAEGVIRILNAESENFAESTNLTVSRVRDGIVFQRDGMTVTAWHNQHIRNKCFDPWFSFSYRIEAEGKRIVYSGDVGNYTELDDVIGDGCDALLIETGHHRMEDVYNYTKNKNIGKIYFTHNGREITGDISAAKEKARQLFGDRGIICEDKAVFEL